MTTPVYIRLSRPDGYEDCSADDVLEDGDGRMIIKVPRDQFDALAKIDGRTAVAVIMEGQ